MKSDPPRDRSLVGELAAHVPYTASAFQVDAPHDVLLCSLQLQNSAMAGVPHTTAMSNHECHVCVAVAL